MKNLSLALVALLLIFSSAQAQTEQEKQDATSVFTRLLKSERDATELVDNLSAYRMLSPWEFSTLVSLSQRMIVAEFTRLEVMTTLMACGEIAAALDLADSGYGELVLRMAWLKTDKDAYAPYAHLSVLERWGVPAYKLIGEMTGKKPEHIEQLARLNKISGAGAFGALLAAYREKYKGMAVEVAKKRKS